MRALALRRLLLPRVVARPPVAMPGAGLLKHVLAWTSVVGALGALGAPWVAQASGLAADPAADSRAWLLRINNAANTGNYQGTMVFSTGGTLSSSRVWHYTMGDQVLEQMETLDGRQQRIVRFNDAVHTLWSQTMVAVVEKREALAAWSTTPQEVDPVALEQYALRREGPGRVAGREAAIFVLEPRDTLRYAQRLWADQATGLMLRADTLAAVGKDGPAILESTAFSEVAIGVATRPPPEAWQPLVRNLRKLDGYRVVRPQLQRTSLEAEGWVQVQAVPGFKLAGCVRRGMGTEPSGDVEPVLQAVFSDGLTHVSLFIEPYKQQRHTTEMQAQQGATATVTQRRGDYWMTAVGDVPLSTLKLFVDSMSRRR